MPQPRRCSPGSLCSHEWEPRLRRRLESLGYRPSSLADALRTSRDFVDWLPARGARDLDVPAFARHQQRAGRQGLPRSVVRFLSEEGLLAVTPTPAPPRLLVDFRSWMLNDRGAKDATLEGYCRILKGLIAALGEDPRHYTPQALQRFVLKHASADHGGHVVTPVRMFVRFLACQGRVPATLQGAVPAVANWRMAALPRGLPVGDVRRLLQSCNRRTALGLRDRAVLLLGWRLALRAGDIAALRLGDIDWRGATLSVTGKGRRACRLPLPQDVGDAILAYLPLRPRQIADDHLFLRAVAPCGPLTRWAVSGIVERALDRTGLQAPSRGAHLLRHSAATTLLQAGATLSSIAALLRHRSVETTALYAKVDFKSLRSIAQPWPQVQPC